MLLVPATKPRSAWRMLVLFFAALLTFGLLTPVTASAHSPTLLRVRDTAVQELDSGYRYAHVKVALNHRVDHKVSVGWYTKAITATPWKDYKPAAGRVFIPKWHKYAYVHVKVYGDTQIEPDEFFKVLLVHPRGARIADRVGIVKICNDDFLPDLEVYKDVAKEGSELLFVVKLSKPAPADVTFNFATKEITADEGTDYTAPTTPATGTTPALPYGTGKIAAGRWATVISVQTLEDSPAPLAEGPEFLKVKLFHVTGANVVDNDALGVIIDK